MNDNNIPNDVHALQEALMHHARQIRDLSDMVTRQWDEIDRLNKHIAKLNAKFSALDDAVQSGDGTGSGGNTAQSVTDIAARNKPPHY